MRTRVPITRSTARWWLVATVLAYFVQQYVLVWVWNAPTVYPLQNALSPPTWAPTEPTF